jgi:hypothetical protein
MAACIASRRLARPTGLEPVTLGLEGRRHKPARDGLRRSGLILPPVSRVGGNCFPPQTVTACHTCVTPKPFKLHPSCALSNRRFVRTPNTNTRWLDDPEPMLDPFRGQDGKDAAHQLQRLSPTGFYRAQHDKADVLAGWVCSDVREVEVESEEDARLDLAPRGNDGIVRAREAFLVDSVALPPGCAQELGGLDGKVLIELCAHTPTLRREGQDSFLRQVGGIRQGRLNAGRRERRVALNDLVGRQPVRQICQHDRNGNPRAANACLPVKDGRIDRDVFAPVHTAIVANVCGLLGTDSCGGRDA